MFDMMLGGDVLGALVGGKSSSGGAVPHFDPVGGLVCGLVSDCLRDALDPERAERRREIEHCNAEARRDLDQADQLRKHDLARWQTRAEELEEELRGQAETLADLKTDIGRELAHDLTPRLRRFFSFDLQQMVGRAPHLRATGEHGSGSLFPSGGLGTSSAVGGLQVGSAFLPHIYLHDDCTEGDLDIAKENLYRAREYLAQVRQAIAELQTQVQGMTATLVALRGEEQTLRELQQRLRRHVDMLTEVQQRRSISAQEADHYTSIGKIASYIRDSLQVQICQSSGATSADYDRYLAQLQRIMDAVPAKPSLHHRFHWEDFSICY